MEILFFLLVGIVAFIAGFTIHYFECKKNVIKGLLPFIDDSGSMAWKSAQQANGADAEQTARLVEEKPLN